MKRRRLLLALAVLGGWPCAALAQQPSVRVALMDSSEQPADMAEGRHPYWSAFLNELKKLGHVENRGLVIDRWSGGGHTTRKERAALADKVIRSRPNLIVARGASLSAAVLAATNEIPVVVVGSIATDAPRKNMTGVSTGSDENRIYGKQVELLHDMVGPGARVAWLGPQLLWDTAMAETARSAAKRMNLVLEPLFVSSPVDDAAMRKLFTGLAGRGFKAVLLSPAGEFFPHRKLIGQLTLAARLPAVTMNRYYTEAGMLMSYGPDFASLYRRAAHQVDKILKGAKPGDVPLEHPTRIELVVNAGTLSAMGLRLPESVRARVDEVVQ